MEDAQRFLRYVIPGLVLMIEVSFYLVLSSHEHFFQFLKDYGMNAGFPLSAFIVSGGIGFCLANIYHFIYWFKCFTSLVPDHRQLIIDVVDRGWLKLENRTDGKEFTRNDIQNLNQKKAWLISSSIWYTRLGSSQRVKEVEPIVNRLVDIMHSLGTTFVGSLIAIPIWFLAHKELSCACPSLWEYFRAVPFMILIVGTHVCHYRKVAKDFQIIADTIASDELQKEFYNKGMIPTNINISQIDLRKLKSKRKKLRIAAILLCVFSFLAILLGFICSFLPATIPMVKDICEKLVSN